MKSFFFSNAGVFIQTLALSLSLIVPGAVLASRVAKGAENPVVVDGTARFTVVTPECIRLEYSAKGKFIDEPSMFAANRSARYDKFTLSKEGGATVIDTGKIRLVYKPDGKAFSASNISATIKKNKGTAEWKPGMKNTDNLGGTIRTVDGVYGPVDLGEGVIARDGWYLLDDSKKHLFTSDWVKQRPADAGSDWYLFGYGEDFAGALRSMTTIGGKTPMPRKYALGAWYSRYWPYTSKEYRSIIKEYEKHDFPLDIIVMDMDWHKDGWTGWSWNRKLLPDAEELLQWFHSQGIAITMNVHPADGIGPHEDMYEDFMREMGADPATKKALPYDCADKKYIDTLFKYTHTVHEKEGVDFWWLDWQQWPYTKSIPDLTNLAWLNHYYYNHTGRDGRRGQSFSRWAGWGDHRYPIHFSGDAHTGWPMLGFEVALTSAAGNIGAFFWSHDIGGHMGPRNIESYTRWVQFGATSAALRSHSTRSVDLDRRPWKYPNWAENSMRLSFHLRSELFPYIYSSAYQVHKDSAPLNRAMYYAYPEKEKAYKNIQQYFYGDALLVSPVVTPGFGPGKVGRQIVWFPEGVWYNWFTGEKFKGDRDALVAADINEFPMYAKGGVPVPMQPYTHRMATTPLKNLVVRVFPGEDGKTGSFTLYEDDGLTTEYKDGKFATTDLTYMRKGGSIAINISPAKGTYTGQVQSRSYTIQLPCTKKATSVKVDGAAAKAEYDAKTRTNTIRIPARPVTKGVKIILSVAEADPSLAARDAQMRRLKAMMKDIKASDTLLSVIERETKSGGRESKFNETLFAIAGLGLFEKNESYYLYKGTPVPYFYAPVGLLDGDSYTFEIVDSVDGKSKTVFTEKRNAKTASVSTMPKLAPLSEGNIFGRGSKRFVVAKFSIRGKQITLKEELESKPSYIKTWKVVGPFSLNRDKGISANIFAPEQGPIDLSASYATVGSKVKWRKAKATEGIVDFNDHFHVEMDHRVAYAVTFLTSEEEQKVTIRVMSDDGAEAFLNGEKMLTRENGEGVDYSKGEEFKATLKPGKNVLLIKVSQFWDNWQMRVAIDSKKGVTPTAE